VLLLVLIPLVVLIGRVLWKVDGQCFRWDRPCWKLFGLLAFAVDLVNFLVIVVERYVERRGLNVM